VRKRKKLIAIVFGLAAISALVALALRDRDPEPAYNGHPLSYWVSEFTHDAHDVENGEPIRQIGTNAFPFLLRWIAFEPSTLRTKTVELAERLPSEWRPDFLDNPQWLFARAADAFQALGPQATNAIPALTLMATNDTSGEITKRCAMALARIGKTALPALLTISTNTSVPGRAYALDAIPLLAEDALPAGPVFIKCLRDPDRNVSETAKWMIDVLRTEPGQPELTNFLASADPDAREFGAFALARFGEVARPAAPQLQNLLSDPDANVRARTRYALKCIAPELLTNTPPERQ
jgi:hypothetical protein